MASIVYNSFLEDLGRGDIDLDTDTFKVLLVENTYTEDKTHMTRADVVGDEATGTGYTAGGETTTLTLTKDNVNDRLDVEFSNVSWANSTITAAGAVIYKDNGGAASGDPLVCFVDFNQDISSTNAAFAVTFSAPLRFQN